MTLIDPVTVAEVAIRRVDLPLRLTQAAGRAILDSAVRHRAVRVAVLILAGEPVVEGLPPGDRR
jgi:hypothetical protein